MAGDLKAWMALDLDEARATQQLNYFDGPGTGKWLDPVRNDTANDVAVKSTFAMADTIDLAAGERWCRRRACAFSPGRAPCCSARTTRRGRITLLCRPPGRDPRGRGAGGFQAAALAAGPQLQDRHHDLAHYAFRDGTLIAAGIHRTAPAAGLRRSSRDMAGLLSRIRRDYASVVFDRAL